MKKILIYFILSLFFSLAAHSQHIQVYTFNEFESLIHKENDSLYLVNFWATWCIPCVKEIPEINKLAEKYAGTKLKILMVSLDMPMQIESRLLPFIKKTNIKSEVILLDDPDSNTWIDKVDSTWSGGIPATLFYSRNSRSFYEQSFEFEELDKLTKLKLNEL
jgi:thiol-disulfide isomerase/thioredoxin